MVKLRAVRWLVAIAAVVLALAVAWVLFVPAADWLAHHDVGSVKGPLLQTARDAARGRLLTLGAGLFAIGALLFTARNFALSRVGQVTDRYTKAIDQLGSDKIDVRIGGIYALERIARDSARDHPAVMEVLTAFIREHSQEQWPQPDPGGQDQERSTRPDIQAAARVIGRRTGKHDIQVLDFHRAILPGANLGGADLGAARFILVDLSGAFLKGANLYLAYLFGTQLQRADLEGANLREADLEAANLSGANLRGANLRKVDLRITELRGANLEGADLREAGLLGSDLSRTKLRGADLRGANLEGAIWPEDAPVPKGWTLDPRSRQLLRAAT
jgi:hypothetical protein